MFFMFTLTFHMAVFIFTQHIFHNQSSNQVHESRISFSCFFSFNILCSAEYDINKPCPPPFVDHENPTRVFSYAYHSSGPLVSHMKTISIHTWRWTGPDKLCGKPHHILVVFPLLKHSCAHFQTVLYESRGDNFYLAMQYAVIREGETQVCTDDCDWLKKIQISITKEIRLSKLYQNVIAIQITKPKTDFYLQQMSLKIHFIILTTPKQYLPHTV